MNKVSGHHQFLFLGKVSNTLTETEEKELEDLFSENEDARLEYKEFVQSLSAVDVSSAFMRYRAPNFYKSHLPPVIKRRRTIRRRLNLLKKTGIAALLIGAIVMAVTMFNNTQKQKNIIADTKKQETIELTLANGTIIDLNKMLGNVNTNNIVLQNSDGVLKYRSNENNNPGVNSLTVPTGMNYQIVLDDGSIVYMNSMTKLEFPSKFTGSKREIRVSGEAYIEVQKDIKRPFIVNLPEAVVKVTGTKFNVNTYEAAHTKVALVEGGVNLTTPKSSIAITPGNQAVYISSLNSLSQYEFDIEKTLSWRKGILYFDAKSLVEIAPVINRWFGIIIKIDNPDLMSKKFTGVLNKNEPIDAFLDDLRNISDVDSYMDNDQTLHFR